MGFYRHVIFPRLMEWSLSTELSMDYRRKTLEAARGQVLEIGYGTGLNLPCYPRSIERLVLLDQDQLRPKLVAQRIAEAGLPVETKHLDAEHLPFESASFDTVVSTWTLCSIPDVAGALVEIRRVLKPGGSLLFLEHGRSDDSRVARRQDRWNWAQKIVGCGCHLNRPIDQLIAASGLTINRLERFDMPKDPKIFAAHYLGRATH